MSDVRELIERAFEEGHGLGGASAMNREFGGYGNTWRQDWEDSDAKDAVEAQGWQPIETAPKDGTEVLLLLPNREKTIGRWDMDKYAVRPKPRWALQLSQLWGRLWERANQPTHWMPIPEPPKETV